MDYQINLITRSQVPSHIFLCGENNKPDFKYIHQFEFSNGLLYIIGAHYRINTAEEIIENMESDFKIINYNNNVEELQEYYKDEFDIYYKYSICKKIWDYYNINKQLIQEVIESYSPSESDSLSESYSSSDPDEGIDSSDELVEF